MRHPPLGDDGWTRRAWLGQWQRFWTTRLDALEHALKDDVAPRARAPRKHRKEDSHD